MSAPAADRRPLVLAGPMGAGKSAVGRRLAAWLGRPFDDLDASIEERERRTIPQLFAAGEATFRAAERRALEAWLGSAAARAGGVLALGGGTLEDARSRADLVARATLVHLDAEPSVLADRLDAAARAGRPLLAGATDVAERLERMRRERAAGYAAAALRIDTSALGLTEAAVALLRALYAPRSGPWRCEPQALDEAFPDVRCGRGALPPVSGAGAVLLIDERLPGVQRRAIEEGFVSPGEGRPPVVAIEGGEGAKSLDRLAECWRALLEAGAERATALVVAGGGTLTDLGGFAAHTFKRGLPLDLLPTTLLAQLDAALGGKNGINFGGIKNVLGTVRLPRSVTIDPLFLLTLPPAELRCGLAEAVKCALIGDAALLDRIERDAESLLRGSLPALEAVTAGTAKVKLAIVARDLEERGARRVLNLGHTLGHALEAAAAAGGEPIPHGDAVAAGTVAALRLSRRRGLLPGAEIESRVRDLFRRLGLPDAPPRELLERREPLRRALAQDKKRGGGRGVWVLLRGVGRPVCETVPDAEVEALLEEFR